MSGLVKCGGCGRPFLSERAYAVGETVYLCSGLCLSIYRSRRAEEGVMVEQETLPDSLVHDEWEDEDDEDYEDDEDDEDDEE